MYDMPTNRQSGSLPDSQPGVIEQSLSRNLGHGYPRRSVDVGEHPRRREAMLIEMRSPNCKFPANGTTWETTEIIVRLPLLPVLDHHQVAGAFIELRKQKPLAALETAQSPTVKSSPSAKHYGSEMWPQSRGDGHREMADRIGLRRPSTPTVGVRCLVNRHTPGRDRPGFCFA